MQNNNQQILDDNDELFNNLDYNQKIEEKENEFIVINKRKIALLKKILQNMKENFKSIDSLLSEISVNNEDQISIGQLADEKFIYDNNNLEIKKEDENNRIIEGVFDGENMIGPDGKQYSVPANYASKSKLIEGDIMKLTITDRGTFIYKQISPIKRSNVVAKLNQDSNGNYYATLDDKKWYLLQASVTYYRGQDGDEIVILVPKTGESKWAAVENIVKKEISENYNYFK